MGSTLTSTGTVALGTGKSLLGSGSVAGRIAAEAGSLILANGNLTLGNATSVIGFQTRGELETGGATVTLLDANQAVLGALTTLGNASQPGTLVAANGALIDFGNNLAGYGTIQPPNNASKVLMINGAAEGRSLSQPLTLTGFVKGMGSLNNVTITGTYSPGLSPAAVSLGSIAYASSATTLIELASTVPGSGYDQLNHSGQAILNGILKVELLDGFQPAIGDAFTFLTATNSISGSFASVQLPALASGRQWQLNYGPNAIILSVIATNVAPTDIALSNALINENRPTNSLVGLLSTADPNAMETFTYTLVAGVGDAGNSSFTIAGNQLRTHAVFNFEQQADYPIRVRTVDSGGLIFEKALMIHVADLPELSGNPVIGNGTPQRSMISLVTMAFDGDIDIATGAFSLIKRGGGGPVTLQTPSIAQVNNQTLVTLTFTGELTRGPQSALVDGYYELIVDGSKITRGGTQLDVNGDGLAGGVYRFGDEEADAFFALFGDANGDGLVGVVEFGQFRSTFGKLPGDTGYNVLFDYDGLGVGVADFGQFRNRFGKPKLVWN